MHGPGLFPAPCVTALDTRSVGPLGPLGALGARRPTFLPRDHVPSRAQQRRFRRESVRGEIHRFDHRVVTLPGLQRGIGARLRVPQSAADLRLLRRHKTASLPAASRPHVLTAGSYYRCRSKPRHSRRIAFEQICEPDVLRRRVEARVTQLALDCVARSIVGRGRGRKSRTKRMAGELLGLRFGLLLRRATGDRRSHDGALNDPSNGTIGQRRPRKLTMAIDRAKGGALSDRRGSEPGTIGMDRVSGLEP